MKLKIDMFNKLKNLIIILIFMMVGCVENDLEKLVLGGWAAGSIVGYKLKVYPNNAFELSHGIPLKGNWMYNNDTIIFLLDEKICAKIYQEKLVEYNNCSELRALTIMEFVENEEPKPLKFPNN